MKISQLKHQFPNFLDPQTGNGCGEDRECFHAQPNSVHAQMKLLTLAHHLCGPVQVCGPEVGDP